MKAEKKRTQKQSQQNIVTLYRVENKRNLHRNDIHATIAQHHCAIANRLHSNITTTIIINIDAAVAVRIVRFTFSDTRTQLRIYS